MIQVGVYKIKYCRVLYCNRSLKNYSYTLAFISEEKEL